MAHDKDIGSSSIADNINTSDQSILSDIKNSIGGTLSPMNSFGKYLTGSRAIIKVNGKIFGFAFRIGINISTDQQELFTIDDWVPAEIVPVRISVNGTLGMFHVPGKGPSAELIQSNLLSFLHHRYITIEIQDQMTKNIIFKTNKAVITNRQQAIQAGEISKIELTWKAMGWIDEMIPEFPAGHDTPDGDPALSGNPFFNIGNQIVDTATNVKDKISKLF